MSVSELPLISSLLTMLISLEVAAWWLMPLMSGCILAAMAGPLGSFVVWRRMAFFGDTLAHGALLGITFGVLLEMNVTLALIVSSIILALILLPLQQQRAIPADAILSIIAHGSLAIGLVALSFANNIRVDLMGYLFGDLLSIQWPQMLLLLGVGIVVLALLIWQWSGLVAVTVSPELAALEGRSVFWLNLLLMILLAMVVAMTMKIVGILLTSALLIIPASSSRPWASSPARMASLASLAGIIAVMGGMLASYYWDTPAGPSIVVSALLIFVVSIFGRIVSSQLRLS